MPLISVIVPVYNMECYLDKCIQSIMNQTHRNLEIILVDDGSTDNSLQLCHKYARMDDRIKVIHKENGGLSSARNAGLETCRGEYIGFVDSDDWIADTMYEKLLSVCKNKKTIATIGVAEVNHIGIMGSSMLDSNRVLSAENFWRRILSRQECCAVCCRLFPRDIIGNDRFDETKLNEDILFLVSLMNKIEWASYSASIGYYYLQREGSISRHFGKVVHDMVGNSIWVHRHVQEFFPSLAKESEYFEIFQHMSFLLCCPSGYDRKSDVLYSDVLAFVRKHLWVGIKNPCFSTKDKLKLIGVSFFPKLMSKMLEVKKRHISR